MKISDGFEADDIQACSLTDCTGLIPSLPQSEAELEAYAELYPYLARARSAQESGDDRG